MEELGIQNPLMTVTKFAIDKFSTKAIRQAMEVATKKQVKDLQQQMKALKKPGKKDIRAKEEYDEKMKEGGEKEGGAKEGGEKEGGAKEGGEKKGGEKAG